MLRGFASLLLFVATALAVLGLARDVFAHPHVWVDYYVDVVGDKNGITKLKFRWHFDDMFTSMVREEFHIRNLDMKDVGTLKAGAFSNLKNYHYYIYTKLDGKEFDPLEVSDFNAALKGKNIEYSFTVDLPQPAKKLELSLFDPEFYVDIGPPMEKPSASKPGIMAPAMMQPKDFISTSAVPGAKPPSCAWQQGQPRVSSSWGKFLLYVVTCEAK